MARHTYLTLATPDEARKLWFDRLRAAERVLPEERVPLRRAFGRVLASPVAARRSSPAFHGAAMDGIAVRADATFAASTRTPLRLEIGREAFWINTGRPLPEGCNAVIMVEHVNVEEDGRYVVIEKPAFPWQHVRKMGEDIVATEIIMAQGTRIGPYELGALAAGGVTEAPVFVRPRVFIIPSGSEIVPLEEAREEDLRAGRVLPEFNSLVFSAMIEEAGGEPVVRPIVPDEPEAIAAALRAALEEGADLVLLNAGSSAGSHDYSADVMASVGEVLTHGVSIMPGKPTVLGVAGQTPVIGTPGYPVSAIVAMESFVQPLLLLWQKRCPDTLAEQRERVSAVPCNPLPSRPGMEELIRVKLGQVDDVFVAVPLSRGAGTVTSLSRADGIIRVPRDCEGLDAGVPATVELLRSRDQLAGALLAIGSHDNTLDLLDSLLRKRHPRFRLTSAHVGSLGGLQALRRGQCHLAGSHLLDEESGVYNRKAIMENLDEAVVLVHLVDREQGLIVAPGNPLGLQGIEDLARDGVRFVNRQRGSGTRVLLDYRLRMLGIAPASIEGYRDEEYTHMNVAAAVLSGRADAGLGVRSAANALGLPFLPVGVEEYDLVIPRRFWDDERMQALMEVVRGEEFRAAVDAMGGYGTARTGEVIWEYDGKQRTAG
ncbi:MAG: molybdopterin biosynthesis protein [Desulfovibrio sp.]|uniref:molybdopterin biosynthesis protein n=1 Tax=Desulfovibrio sp. TaxID=885 RepID=UPI0025BFEF44|nr:molybdopterin biosynthesis protein [Desulfovibrio sp.]MCI7569711.1 molybdopterin biosynthesis protein [Desulfovibrio sp.]